MSLQGAQGIAGKGDEATSSPIHNEPESNLRSFRNFVSLIIPTMSLRGAQGIAGKGDEATSSPIHNEEVASSYLLAMTRSK